MTRLDEINNIVEVFLEDTCYEDTPEVRIAFLEGLRDCWKEDPEQCLEKSLYLMTLGFELMRLKTTIPV